MLQILYLMNSQWFLQHPCEFLNCILLLFCVVQITQSTRTCMIFFYSPLFDLTQTKIKLYRHYFLLKMRQISKAKTDRVYKRKLLIFFTVKKVQILFL